MTSKKIDNSLFRIFANPGEVIFNSVNPRFFSDSQLRSFRRNSLEDLLLTLEDDRLIAIIATLIVEQRDRKNTQLVF